ncbi:MAG: alpha/beta hydrolase [Actinomycetes bacterium]
MPNALINGVTLHYEDTGSHLPVVVLSHGFLMDHEMFVPQVAALRSTHRVVTWDERGFGGTLAADEFTYWDSAKDVLGLMDHLSIDSAVIGGMSQGGFLSLRVALTAPERVRGLILLDTQAGLEEPGSDEGYMLMHDTWMEHGPEPIQEFIASLILGPGEWPEWFAKWARLDKESFSRAFRCLLHRDDITSRLGSISCPALVIHGDADLAIPLTKAEALRSGLGGNVQYVVVPGGPHAANLTHPEPVNAAITQFLATL